jgi:hypothetical protein
VTAAGLRERLDERREDAMRLLTLAYQEPPPAWPLRDVAAPLVLELVDLAREAIEELEEAGRA